jgi:urease gamma subunit
MITKFNTYNESLRSKLKGPSEDEVDDSINYIIFDIVDELISADLYSDRDELFDIIRDKYMDDILFGVEEGQSPYSITTFVVDLIKDGNTLTESLRDKLKGPSDEEVHKGIDNLISEIAQELCDLDDFDDHQTSLETVHNYYDTIKNMVDNDWDYDTIKDEMVNYISSDLAGINESLRDKIKGKSEEEISKVIDKYKKTGDVRKFDDVIGKTLIKVTVEKNKYKEEQIIFKFDDGTIYVMYHEQDCSETVYIEDINGDLDDLVGVPLLTAEEVCADNPNAQESGTWSFYKFATIKGYVDIRWYGHSNGYYSERVNFEKEER